MILRVILILFFGASMFTQDPAVERKVMRKHANGVDHVVLYFSKESGDLTKEEVYFTNGKLQWSGSYKNDREDGAWQFYYDNGNLKTVENYSNGREHGVATEFSAEGKKIKESFWKHGKLIRESKF